MPHHTMSFLTSQGAQVSGIIHRRCFLHNLAFVFVFVFVFWKNWQKWNGQHQINVCVRVWVPQIQVTVISFINGKMINAQPVCDQGIAKNEMVENNICVENIVHWQPSKPDVSRPPNFSDLSLLSYFLSIIIQFKAETAAIYEIRESSPWKGLTLKESPTLSKMLQNPHKVFDNIMI